MAELNVPNYMTNRPESISDLAESAMRMQESGQNQRMNEMKMTEYQQSEPVRRQLQQAQVQDESTKAAAGRQKIIGNLAGNVLGQLDKSGITDPQQRQQFITQAIDAHKPYLQGVLQLPVNDYMSEDQLRSLSKSASGGEYHPPVATSEGYLQFDNGAFAPMLNAQGKPYMPGAVDVSNKFDIGMAGSLSKLVEQGYIDLPTAQSILKNQVMGQGQPQQPMQQRQTPQVFIDQNMSPEDQELAQQDYNTFESNVASQNQKGGIPDAAQRETIKTQADIDKAVGVEAGKSQFEANRDLPAAIDQAANALDLIKKLKEHPGKAGFVGMPNASGLLGGVRGTKEADFKSRLEQIKGQTFLQAFNSLKGAGQITEVEGTKAEQAIARLDASQSEKEFDAALDDLSNIIDQGVVRAKTKAGGKNQSNNIKDDADAILRK